MVVLKTPTPNPQCRGQLVSSDFEGKGTTILLGTENDIKELLMQEIV